MEYIKIKDLRFPGNKNPATKKQMESRKKSGIKTALSGRLKKYEFKKFHKPHNTGKHRSEATKKKESETKKKNYAEGKTIKYWKGKHLTEQAKQKIGMKNSGKPCNEKSRNQMIKNVLLNNPMKNPEIAKRNGELRRKKISEELFNKILKEFNSGKSINQLAKENNLDGRTLSKILKRNGIKFDANERRRIASLNNPNVKKSWFKKTQKEVNNEIY